MSRKKYLSKEFSLKGKSEIGSTGGAYGFEKLPFCFKMLLKMGWNEKSWFENRHENGDFGVLNYLKKVKEILKDPYRFKPLKKPMQNKRRVHVGGPFVLIYEVNEEKKIVTLVDFDHHDKIYMSWLWVFDPDSFFQDLNKINKKISQRLSGSIIQ